MVLFLLQSSCVQRVRVFNKRLLSEKEKLCCVHVVWCLVLHVRKRDLQMFYSFSNSFGHTTLHISSFCDATEMRTWVLLLYAQRWRLCVANFIDTRSQHNRMTTEFQMLFISAHLNARYILFMFEFFFLSVDLWTRDDRTFEHNIFRGESIEYPLPVWWLWITITSAWIIVLAVAPNLNSNTLFIGKSIF